MAKSPIGGDYPVQAPLLTDAANIVAAIQLYHLGEGGDAETPAADSITAYLTAKANVSAPTISNLTATNVATFNDSVILGSSGTDVVTFNANISANGLVVTPTQLSYLSTNKTGTANLVFSTSPTILTPNLDAPIVSNTATFNNNVVLGSSNADTITIRGNISANSLVVTVDQLGYLNTASGKTGSGTLVFGTSPTILTPTIDTPSISNTATFNGTTTAAIFNGNVTVTTGKQFIGNGAGLTNLSNTAIAGWNATNWNTAYTDRNKWDGGSTGLDVANAITSLGGTTVGKNIFSLTNPSAKTFLRLNADNTVSALDAETFRTEIGAGSSNASGTVTSISVATANGFAGTVATANTTPVITIKTGVTGLLKGDGTAVSAATAGTDYLQPPIGTSILKAGSGGALANATAGTDYLQPPSGTSILKANNNGALANAIAGTDYLEPPSGTSLLKANSNGPLVAATAGTDYLVPNGTAAITTTGLITANGGIAGIAAKNMSVASAYVNGIISTTGTIGTVSGTGPYTATITSMSSTKGLYVGQVITATSGTGNFGAGTVTVASIVSSTSITISSTATFTAGTVTNISTTSGFAGQQTKVVMTAAVTGSGNPTTRPDGTTLQPGDVWISW